MPNSSPNGWAMVIGVSRMTRALDGHVDGGRGPLRSGRRPDPRGVRDGSGLLLLEPLQHAREHLQRRHRHVRLGAHRAVARAGGDRDLHVLALEVLTQGLVGPDAVPVEQQRAARRGRGRKRQLCQVELSECGRRFSTEHEAARPDEALRQQLRPLGVGVSGVVVFHQSERSYFPHEARAACRGRPQHDLVDGCALGDRLAGHQAAEAHPDRRHAPAAGALAQPRRGGCHRVAPCLYSIGVPRCAAAVAGAREVEAQGRVPCLGEVFGPCSAWAVGADVIPAEGRADQDRRRVRARLHRLVEEREDRV